MFDTYATGMTGSTFSSSAEEFTGFEQHALMTAVAPRFILENAAVRASAVNSLARFGMMVPELREAVESHLRVSIFAFAMGPKLASHCGCEYVGVAALPH